MGKAILKAIQQTNWNEIRDIYIKVLKEGWGISIERVRDDGTYIFKLDRLVPHSSDLGDWQMGEMGYQTRQCFRVLCPMEEE